MKHTHGEWALIPEQFKLVSEQDDTIASFCFGGNMDEALANAQLASAAPDLLAACQIALAHLLLISDKVPNGVRWQINDAINKATGKTVKNMESHKGDTFVIFKTNDVKHTRYISLTDVPGGEAAVFEGCTINGERRTPLAEAKLYAKKHGYSFLAIDPMSVDRIGKTYDLTKE